MSMQYVCDAYDAVAISSNRSGTIRCFIAGGIERLNDFMIDLAAI